MYRVFRLQTMSGTTFYWLSGNNNKNGLKCWFSLGKHTDLLNPPIMYELGELPTGRCY